MFLGTFYKLIEFCLKINFKNFSKLLILVIIKILLFFATVFLLKQMINLLVEKQVNIVFCYLFYYIITFLFSKCIVVYYDYIQQIFKLELEYKINSIFIDKCKNMSMIDFENTETYNSIQKTLRDINVPYAMILNVLDVITNISMLIGSIIILAKWKLYTVIYLVIVPICCVYLVFIIGKKEYEMSKIRIINVRKSNYYRFLLTDINSYKENKIFRLGVFFTKNFIENIDKINIKDKLIFKYLFINGIIFQILETIMLFFTVYIVLKDIINSFITIGTGYLYLNCILNVVNSSEKISKNISNLLNKKLYLDELFEFIYKKDPNINNKKYIKIKKIETIEFKNVWFKYRENLEYAIKNINLKINANDKIIIIGENGSGKSTFIKLLCGFYDNYEGEILINGISMKEIEKESLYNNLSVLFQDYMRYEFNVEDNICISDLNEKDKIINFIKKLNQQNILKFLDYKGNIKLGHKFDDGYEISNGEWQQIAFSRAIFKRNSCLILDEPTTSTDIDIENNIFNIINDIQNNIVILITHKLYLLNNSYKWIVFSNGKILKKNEIKKMLKYKEYYGK